MEEHTRENYTPRMVFICCAATAVVYGALTPRAVILAAAALVAFALLEVAACIYGQAPPEFHYHECTHEMDDDDGHDDPFPGLVPLQPEPICLN